MTLDPFMVLALWRELKPVKKFRAWKARRREKKQAKRALAEEQRRLDAALWLEIEKVERAKRKE